MTTWTESDAAGRPAQPSSQQTAAGVHVIDSRGLTAVGAVAVALVVGAAGALIDVFRGEGLSTVFAVCFIGGCAWAALKVHREDLVAVVVMPPLVYVAIALLADAFSNTTATGGWVTRQVLELVTSLVLGAPVLLSASALTLAIAVIRGRRARSRQAAAKG